MLIILGYILIYILVLVGSIILLVCVELMSYNRHSSGYRAIGGEKPPAPTTGSSVMNKKPTTKKKK